MREVDFSTIKSVEDVAKYFYTSPEYLEHVLAPEDQKILYEEMKIPKKGIGRRGQHRIVYKPEARLSQLQKNIGLAIERSVEFPKYVQGFVKGRSTRSNAEQHLAQKYLLKADIKDFFESINTKQISHVFLSLGCIEEIARILAMICSINGTLSQGLHTSPILSNLVVQDLDFDLYALANTCEATYTRYGDDITMSSSLQLPSRNEIEKLFNKHGFIGNEDKYQEKKRGESQFVTGLSVFDSRFPRVPKRMKKRLRLNLHYIQKYGLEGHLEHLGVPDFAFGYYYKHLKGTLDYINAIEPDLHKKMLPLLPPLLNQKDREEAEQLAVLLRGELI